MMQLLNAVSAQSVTTVDEYAGDALSNIVLEGTKLADIKTTRFVVEVHNGS
jgi:hypothetical protein